MATDAPQIDFISLPAINLELLRAYADASGDYNPIHQDESVARSAGLPGVIAHGMLSAAFISERALQAIEERPEFQGFRLLRFQARFKAMVRPGDLISVGGSIKESGPERVVLELQARNQRGEAVTLGTAEFARLAA